MQRHPINLLFSIVLMELDQYYRVYIRLYRMYVQQRVLIERRDRKEAFWCSPCTVTSYLIARAVTIHY